MTIDAASLEAIATEDKSVVLMISRDREARHIPDLVAATLARLQAAPKDGFAVRPVDAEGGIPAHLRVSFDPVHGAIDRDLVAAALAAPLALALGV